MTNSRTKRYFIGSICMLLLLSLFMGMTLTLSSGEVYAENESKKTFTVGFDASFPPYGYRDENGEYVGFDLDLAEEVCSRKGWTLKKQPIDWDSKDMELDSGAIDCIWNGFTINGRENDYTWSEPYVDNSQVVIVKADSKIKSLSDLKGKTVVVQADSSALAAFTGDDATEENKSLAKSFKELQQVSDYNSAFLNLESGMVDAICMDIGVASYQVKQRGEKYIILSEEVSSEQYGVGFKLGNTALRDEVMEVLYAMKADGKFDEIAKKWELETAVCLKEAAPEFKINSDRKTLTVGFDASFPPYGYRDEKGEYVGFDLDLAEEVCTRKGWTLKKQPIDWDSKDMELDSGAIDCIWNGFTINGRENDYTWSEPYVDNSQVVIVKADSKIKSLSDLKGKTVVVQADSSALAAFTGDDATEENKSLAKSFKELQQVSDYNSAFLNLESGMVDAICMDIGVASYQVKQRGEKYIILSEEVSSEQYGVGFKLGNTALRDEVMEVLYAMKADGKFDEIAKKWELETAVCLKAAAPKETTADESQPEKTAPAQSATHMSVGQIALDLLGGMGATLLIFCLTLIFALPLGLILTFIRMTKIKVIQLLAKFYISVMRGTPLMLQLLVVCYGPHYVFGLNTDSSFRFYAVIIGFSLNYAAYFAEIFRAGIQAVPIGQREAASVLGYSRGQTFRKIVFPQMVKNILPPMTNEVITLVKDTSLAFALAYTEVFTLAKQIAAAEANIMPLFVAGVFYYVFNLLVAFIMGRIEKKLNYYH